MTDLAQKQPTTLDDHTQQIVYAISHDLQGPTRLIRSFLQLLEADLGADLSEESRKYLQCVATAAGSLQERLGAITLLSRVSSRGEEPQPCRIQDVLEDSLAFLDPMIREAGATVQTTPSEAVVLADRAQLIDVFNEIVGNSLKFCAAPAQIGISIESNDGRCVVSISDSGPGFRARSLDDAFDLFRRFHPATIPGTGTGLAIVRRILERHDTSVSIESGQDSDTTVTFDLALTTDPLVVQVVTDG